MPFKVLIAPLPGLHGNYVEVEALVNLTQRGCGSPRPLAERLVEDTVLSVEDIQRHMK